MEKDIQKVLLNVLFRVNRALDCLAEEGCRQEVLSHLVLAGERLEVAKALWQTELIDREEGM